MDRVTNDIAGTQPKYLSDDASFKSARRHGSDLVAKLMLLQDPNVQVWLYTQPTDMRKHFDGLAAIAKNKMAGKLVEGQLFVFVNRKRTYMKALYYSRGGLCVWSKRLERGHFHGVQATDKTQHKAQLR